MSLEAAVVIGAGVLCIVLLWWRRGSGSRGARLPLELRSARLVYAERLFRSYWPVSISAKVDRVYRNAAGVLVLVELKTREANRVYLSDVIELSAQRFALMAQTGEVVANHAYVVTELRDGRRTGCHQIRLMAHANVIDLATRRKKLLDGKIQPRPTFSLGMCRRCAFVRPCDPPWF